MESSEKAKKVESSRSDSNPQSFNIDITHEDGHTEQIPLENVLGEKIDNVVVSNGESSNNTSSGRAAGGGHGKDKETGILKRTKTNNMSWHERLRERFKLLRKKKSGNIRKQVGLTFLKFCAWIVLVFFTLFIGALCFCIIEEEQDIGWPACFNFATATLTTVGYGDITASTDGMKIFIIFYLFFGLLFFSFLLGNIAATFFDLYRFFNPYETSSTKKKLDFRREYLKIIYRCASAFCLSFIIVGIGTAYWCLVLDLSFLDGVYWSMETVTTVGYGDLLGYTDLTTNQLYFSTFYMLLGGGFYITILGYCAAQFSQLHTLSKYHYLDQIGLSEDMIERMDLDGDCEVDREEFLRYMVVEMGFMDADNLDFLDGLFDRYDKDGQGTINKDDMTLARANSADVKPTLFMRASSFARGSSAHFVSNASGNVSANTAANANSSSILEKNDQKCPLKNETSNHGVDGPSNTLSVTPITSDGSNDQQKESVTINDTLNVVPHLDGPRSDCSFMEKSTVDSRNI